MCMQQCSVRTSTFDVVEQEVVRLTDETADSVDTAVCTVHSNTLINVYNTHLQ